MSRPGPDDVLREIFRLRKDTALGPLLVRKGKESLEATPPDFDVAIECFRAAMEIAPDNPEAARLLEEALQKAESQTEREIASRRIVIETLETARSVFDEFIARSPEDIFLVDVKGFHGESDLVHAIVTLSPLTLPVVTGIILELIRARTHVSVKLQGVELRGLSEETAGRLLAKLLQEPSADDPGPPIR